MAHLQTAPQLPPETQNEAGCKNCNLILIALDPLRADHLGAYGYFRNTSPNIDALALEGTLFESAYAQGGWTALSFASAFTAKYPQGNGLVLPNLKLSDSELTLAEILKQNGFATGAFTGGMHLMKEYGFSQGFDAYDDGLENLKPLVTRTPDESISKNMISLPIARSISRAKEWIGKNKERQFFAFIHGYDTHCPYQLEPGDSAIFSEENQQLNAEIISECDKTHYRNASKNKLTQIIGLYDDKILNTDAKIGEFIHWLKGQKLYGKTIIIFFSDHGELFQESKRRPIVGHGFTLNPIIRVPLIMRVPGKNHTPRTSQLVELVDVAPTALELLGIPPNQRAQGNSLAPALEGVQLNKSYVHAANFLWSDDKIMTLAVANSKRKLVLEKYLGGKLMPENLFENETNAGKWRVSLYDFQNDAGDNFDKSSEEPETVQKLMGEMRDWWSKNLKSREYPSAKVIDDYFET